jgi:hypothetical protein
MEAGMCFELHHGLADISILSQPEGGIKCTNIRQPMLKLKNILASMIYFDSDMSKSGNTVAYFDWKTGIHIYVCGKCRTQFMLPKSSRR